MSATGLGRVKTIIVCGPFKSGTSGTYHIIDGQHRGRPRSYAAPASCLAAASQPTHYSYFASFDANEASSER